ncbi:hypothetical protein [Streptomyces sp. NPDC053726]|uniref:hypothetical protein n=1 Tax=Streptomyces sp. NPDC053726 TaxID=3365713 RepID=UPI0037D4861F
MAAQNSPPAKKPTVLRNTPWFGEWRLLAERAPDDANAEDALKTAQAEILAPANSSAR